MYSGFVAPRKTIDRAPTGTHQRFDMAAYRMIKPLLPEDSLPTIKEILKFEGYDGPDGLKVKSSGDNDPSHLYDPDTDIGAVPSHIEHHYNGLVDALRNKDKVRAAFEAGWMAHYICDGVTPAHHWPLDKKLAEADAPPLVLEPGLPRRLVARVKKEWVVWGAKGHLSTHHNFELGVVFALVAVPIRMKIDLDEWKLAQELGPVEYFKKQARYVASYNLYEKFYQQGWSAEIAKDVKDVVVPAGVRAIGLIWLLAVEQAGYNIDSGGVRQTRKNDQ